MKKAWLMGAATLLIGTTAWGVQGSIKYFNAQGYGACGVTINASTQLLASVPSQLWTTSNPTKDPLCKKTVRVTYNGKLVILPIKDKCTSCAASTIEVSQPAYVQLTGGTSPATVTGTWVIQ